MKRLYGLPYYDSPTDFGTSRLEPRPYSHLEDGIVAGVQLEKTIELLAHAHPYRRDIEGKKHVLAGFVVAAGCGGEEEANAHIHRRVEPHPRPVEIGEPHARHEGKEHILIDMVDHHPSSVGIVCQFGTLHHSLHTHLTPVRHLVIVVQVIAAVQVHLHWLVADSPAQSGPESYGAIHHPTDDGDWAGIHPDFVVQITMGFLRKQSLAA